ncbi:uncharacterized protein FFUJ_09073 [Fusarium fujikuroi IMI 58289]|uniref:Zn(II)2Cys6 transcriptional activator n=1 Tax=Gibberella fujikuroi (strain CBS 195.34 / IMI 58289 / NRRL A-6831) TaxID=1279085 RepID=S0EEU3_GIBF5|nr:uncharacterized protein FFUJ_09073 [Fusarium fujikuroi IMI 58289]CCT70903.1 uncharacterized protein FFUJ_09073 [Fusarium fujikuroi IMI 58289]SCO02715.1 uncharacterized protein FFM5_07957 [Fusarium fujikuroi]SCO53064.1 uncharacterized protein FFMR_11354 [Fusarium fujikuroi]
MQKALVQRRASRLPYAPQWSPDVSSRHSFLSLFIGTYSSAFDILPALLADSVPDGSLQLSVDAASLAFMAFQLNRFDLIPLANKYYFRAIRSLAMAVQSSIQPTSNAPSQSLSAMALQSVLLLDFYDKMAFQHYQPSEAPGLLQIHAKGSLSILRSLPKGELRNPATLQLATQSILVTILSCGADATDFPEHLIGLYNELGSYIQSDRWHLIGHYIRLVNIHINVRNGKMGLSDALKRAREYSLDIVEEENKMSRLWRPYRRDTCEARAFDSHYDAYPNHKVAQALNKYRIMRLGVASFVHRLTGSVEVAEDVEQLVRTICASVPQIILPEARPQNTLPFSPLQILECSAVLSPLYLCARHTRDPAMRAWILQTLEYMADNGVKMAQTLANIIESPLKPEIWDWFRMVGSYTCSAL